jgi:glyoxylase-like metal-dependent hydrolase (beta-lactamase superfamily II)
MERKDFDVRSFKGGFDDNFTYLVTCGETGAQFLVDAAVPYERLASFIEPGLSHVLITHAHGDHTAHLDEYLNAREELKVVLSPVSAGRVSARVKIIVGDGEVFEIGKLSMKAIHTPGHSPDGVCYRLGYVVFTGDTLFVGRTGRTLSGGADTRELYRSVYEKLLTLPGRILLYPGHDYGPRPTITIGENIELSPLLRARDEDDFVKRMADFEASRR